MIKLTLSPIPEFLSVEKQKELTDRFIADNSQRVWNIPALKEVILTMSYGKCVYSEIKLNEEGKYMQIEHFYPKSRYPDKVLEWGNLMASSNICNAKKNDCDPYNTPIVNPFIDNPKDYFYIENGRIWPLNKSRKAINTLEKCDLNNHTHLRQVRYKIEQKLSERLNICHSLYQYEAASAIKNLKSIMKSCGRKAAFSATKSTLILSNSDYLSLKGLIKNDGYWDFEFDSLEQELSFCSLPKPKYEKS